MDTGRTTSSTTSSRWRPRAGHGDFHAGDFGIKPHEALVTDFLGHSPAAHSRAAHPAWAGCIPAGLVPLVRAGVPAASWNLGGTATSGNGLGALDPWRAAHLATDGS